LGIVGREGREGREGVERKGKGKRGYGKGRQGSTWIVQGPRLPSYATDVS